MNDLDIVFIFAVVIALFFAMNIGASGTAASMGAAYGSGAISKKWSLYLCAIACFIGALFGGEVVKTIGSGIVPASSMEGQFDIVLIILIGATLTLFIANLMGIPLSTSEVTVGSVVGVGIALRELMVWKLFVIVMFWVS